MEDERSERHEVEKLSKEKMIAGDSAKSERVYPMRENIEGRKRL